jgi:hypothetical protein
MAALQQRRPSLSPRGVASVVQKLRSASLIALWGPSLSYGLALPLKLALQAAYSPLRRWWSRGKVWLTKSVRQDMACIAALLLEPEFSPVGSQYIGLLVPCHETHTILSDASYAGIGGWSPDFCIQWRVTPTDLIDLGFAMKIIDLHAAEPLDATSTGHLFKSPGVPQLHCQHVDSPEFDSASFLVPGRLHPRSAVGQHLCALMDEIDCYHSRSLSSSSCSFCLDVIGHCKPTSNPRSASSYSRKGQRQSGLPQLLREWANT